MKIKTFPYKGSKRKLLSIIEQLASEINAVSIFDGFSGTGIVAAHFRNKGFLVYANDLGEASCLAGRVFLNGFDEAIVSNYIEQLNQLEPIAGWLTENYGGDQLRKVRGKAEKETRPLGFTKSNAEKIDAARDYLELLKLDIKDKDALIFSIILATNSVFNGTTDQKSSLKEWSANSQELIKFSLPTLINGHVGTQTKTDILDMKYPDVDFVYLDPPYGSGVLYPACYHINDSIVSWSKPILNAKYAIPRPQEICFNENKVEAGGFYNKKTAKQSLEKLLKSICEKSVKRIVISYSDAPRNVITYNDLEETSSKFGTLKIVSKDHKICSQPGMMKKTSQELTELFFVIDVKQKEI